MYPVSMRRLINELTKLPSVGDKSATRLAYHLITRGRHDGLALSAAIQEAIEKVSLCKVCHFIAEGEVCPICQDERRNRRLLCAVEKPADVIALERSGGYRGLYHVLHGVWSPLKGVGPEQTRMQQLLERLNPERSTPQTDDPLQLPLEELILATSTTVEGDATALYVANAVQSMGVVVSRLAQGLPKGGELEYADELTLHLSLEGRRSL
ncbi:MAG: recombination protein RecR [Bdellovibrionales bacterium]|nr:recombination protein RecR [Bdellovibrionales bacterium]